VYAWSVHRVLAFDGKFPVTIATSSQRHLFTVVIASLCDEARSELLRRACESVRTMADGLDYSILVVANGQRTSPSVLDWLQARPDVRLVRLRTGSYPLARRVGAELADCEFLAFLDDDDELLPRTLGKKVAEFRQHPEIDVLVSDGLRINGPKETNILPPLEARSDDLIETMMHTGWGACALTLRTRNVDLSVFDTETRHLEWTLTTLRLASRYRFGLLDEPTYRYYEDTPNSLWKSSEHVLTAPKVWRQLSLCYAGTRYEDIVLRRFGRACHGASWENARRGDLREAWRLQLEALKSPGGIAILPSLVKLLGVSLYTLAAREDQAKEGR
jgi:hypothetical protein